MRGEEKKTNGYNDWQ